MYFDKQCSRVLVSTLLRRTVFQIVHDESGITQGKNEAPWQGEARQPT